MLSHKAKGIVFLFTLLLCPLEAVAQRIDAANYRYPYNNPFVATSTVALMQGHEALQHGKIRNLEINVLDGRDNIPLLEDMGKLRYRFYQREEPAPLIFIVPGIASSAYVGSARYLAEFLAGHGFHVLVLPSPYHWNFALAASRSGSPGLIQEDAEDLYNVMQITLQAVQQQYHAQVSNIGFFGFSEGAHEAAYVAKLDMAQRSIGIDRYLLVNPPVNLLTAIKRIDTMAGLEKNYTPQQRDYLQSYALGMIASATQQGDPFSPDYFADWDKRARLDDKQYQYLIGNELQKSVGDTIYVDSLAFNPDILKTPIAPNFRAERLKEARSYNLRDYVERFVLPKIRQSSDPRISVEKLNTQTSLKNISSTLENNKNIFLMHNLDDFLVSAEDFAFLEQVLGDRAKLYPHGGHLGNLWYEENKYDYLEIFKPLLQNTAPQ